MRTIRAILLYLFALASALPTLVTRDPAVATGPGAGFLWALAVAVSLGAGLRLEATFASIENRRRRLLAGFLATLQMSILVLSVFLAAIRPTSGLLSFLASFLAGYFLVVLALAGLSPHPRSVLAHGMVLTSLTCLQGGELAAVAAVLSFVLGALFVGVDHHHRILVAYRIDPNPYAKEAMARALGVVLPVGGLFALLIAFAPLETPVGRGISAVRKTEVELDPQAFRGIVVAGLIGATAIYFVSRLMSRTKRENPRTLEVAEPFRGQPERIEEKRPERPVRRAGGRRGRIIDAYLTLLDGLARKGFARAPHETPEEFAAALGEPQALLATLTRLFMAARWGAAEPLLDDVATAERSAQELTSTFDARPPRRRAGTREDM